MFINPLKSLNIKTVYKKICGENTHAKLAEKVKPFIEKNAKKAVEEWKIARKKMKDIPGTNYNLGLLHMKKGNIDDAILRFKMVIFLTPDKADAYYNLARCLVIIGDNDSALENLEKALALKPEFPEARYVIEKIKSPQTIENIPANVIAEHLDWREGLSEEGREARGQKDKIMVTMALENITDKNPNLMVLDLGCAEGGRGLLLKSKEVARRVVGVDLWEKATKQAKEKKYDDNEVYAALHNTEILKYIGDNQEKYDLILAGSVFSYMGNLDNIFNNITQALVAGGLFVIIINKREEQLYPYKIDISKDKFTHSVGCFEDAIKKHGFIIADKKEKKIADGDFYIIVARFTVSRDAVG